MGLYNAKAIVLRTINLSETDKLAILFTEQYGKVKCAAKAARKVKSRFGAALEPLSFISVIFFGKEKQEIFRLNHSDVIRSFHWLREDFSKFYTAIYFNELMDNVIQEGQPSPECFQFLLDAFEALKDTTELETLRRLFEIRIMTLSGFGPRLSQCLACPRIPDGNILGFSFRMGGIVCEKCLRKTRVELNIRTGTLNYIKKMMHMDIKHCQRLKIPKNLEKEIENVTHRLVSYNLGRELRSYPFIKQMAML
jgi:DNA repair protein RecO (recombination protein O)